MADEREDKKINIVDAGVKLSSFMSAVTNISISKRHVRLAGCLLVLILIAVAIPSLRSGPAKTVKNFLDAVIREDSATALRYCSPEAHNCPCAITNYVFRAYTILNTSDTTVSAELVFAGRRGHEFIDMNEMYIFDVRHGLITKIR